MEFIWQEFSIEVFFIKLWLMTIFQLMQKMNLFSLRLQEETKYGSLFYKNVGQNFIKAMLLLVADYHMKFYMHFQAHLHFTTVCQKINKIKMHCFKCFTKLIKKEQFFVVELNLIYQFRKKVLWLDMHTH